MCWSPRADVFGMSEREKQVLRLVSQGLRPGDRGGADELLATHRQDILHDVTTVSSYATVPRRRLRDP